MKQPAKTRDDALSSIVTLIRAMSKHGPVRPKDIKDIARQFNIHLDKTIYTKHAISLALDLDKSAEEVAQDMLQYARDKRRSDDSNEHEVISYPPEQEQLTLKFDITDYTLRDLINAGIKVEVHAYVPTTNKQQV